jgi:methylenetetrahydrofolate reductase (NADPH)
VEGARLAAEVIAAVREMPGVSGVHLLTAGYEKQTPDLLRMAGVDRSALVGKALAGKSSDGH